MEEERVDGVTVGLYHLKRARMGELVARADHEIVEREFSSNPLRPSVRAAALRGEVGQVPGLGVQLLFACALKEVAGDLLIELGYALDNDW